MHKILLLGAGELGTPILHHLLPHLDQSTQLSLVVRPSTLADPASSQSPLAKLLDSHKIPRIGLDTARASTDELVSLFRSYDAIVSASGMAAPPGTQLKLAQAVLAAGVKRYIPWQFGLDYDAIGRGGAQDLFDEQLDVRALLRGQRETEWVIISTGIFMTFLFEEAFGVVVDLRGGGKPTVRALGSWENKVTYTHPEDIGRVTTEVIVKAWDEVKNGVVFVAGDTVSFDELATRVGTAAGSRGVAKELWDLDHLERELAAAPTDGMRKYRVVLAEGTGVAWEKDVSWNALKEMPVKTMADYAKEVRG